MSLDLSIHFPRLIQSMGIRGRGGHKKYKHGYLGMSGLSAGGVIIEYVWVRRFHGGDIHLES